MQKIKKELLFPLLTCLLFSACGTSTVSKPDETDIDSIPIEIVDAETNGKRSGETHLSLNSGELYLSYEYFDSNETTNFKYLEKKQASEQILKTEDVLDKDKKKVGEKSLIALKNDEKKFCLIWTKNKKLTKVCAKSLKAITEFENKYKI